jgi:hypothetical protein
VFRGETRRAGKRALALSAVAAILRDTSLIPLVALEEAIRMGQYPDRAQENLRAVEQSAGWL